MTSLNRHTHQRGTVGMYQFRPGLRLKRYLQPFPTLVEKQVFGMKMNELMNTYGRIMKVGHNELM